MLDIALIQTSKGYDIDIENGDLKAVNNFETAIYVSLFSDARADNTEVFLPQARRGWVCDVASPIENLKYGSKLWLLSQARLTQDTLNKAVSYARLALQWIVDQGQAEFVSVTGTIVPTQGIQLNIVITTKLGVTESHYIKLWENTINAN